jgi:outer membrane lipoprotein-sorting protein
MKKLFLKWITVVILSYVAESQASTPLSQASPASIAKVESYLNGVKTLTAQFLQTNPDGSVATGAFYLNRPGKMRLAYNPPSQLLIVADGDTLYHHDLATNEVNSFAIDATPANFLLQPRINFNKGLKVTQSAEKPGLLEITLARADDEEGMSLKLIFLTKPILVISGWIVTDAQGLKTHVVLKNVQIGMKLNQSLFKFQGF